MLLIIEDDAVSGKILQTTASRIHHKSIIATTGAEALAILDTVPIDMVVADLYLPDVQGFGLIRDIKSRPYLADLPILCCTANADLATVMEARSIGITDFLAKPVNLLEFTRRIQRMIQLSPRWEDRDVYHQRLSRSMTSNLLQLAAAAVDECIEMLQTEYDPTAMDNHLVCMIGSAQQVGAIGLARQIKNLWPSDPDSLITGLKIERASISQRYTHIVKSDMPSLEAAVMGPEKEHPAQAPALDAATSIKAAPYYTTLGALK